MNPTTHDAKGAPALIELTTDGKDSKVFYLNQDLILQLRAISGKTGTSIEMVDGRLLHVKDTPTDVIDKMMDRRIEVLRRASQDTPTEG